MCIEDNEVTDNMLSGNASNESSYDIIIADPPYGYCGEQGEVGAAVKTYPTMSDDELLAFIIREHWMIDRSDGFGLVFRPKAANDNRAASTGEVAQ